MKRILLSIVALVWLALPVWAQVPPTMKLCFGNPCTLVTVSNPFPVSGTFSASLAGFPTIQSTGTPIAVTSSAGGVTGTLPTGTVVVASNVGATNGAYCKLGASSTTSDQLIPPNSWFAFTVGANTQLTCITSTSTTTVNMVGGSGLPTGSGGGAGGSGGGGAITAAINAYAAGSLSAGAFATGAGVDGWDLTQGAKADAAWVSGSGSLVAIAKTIANNTGAAIPDCGADPCTNKLGLTYNRPATGTYTDRSGAITTGGTSQTLAASNSTRRQLMIQNPCTATEQNIATAENLFINFTSAATTAGGNSVELLPCGSVQLSQGTVTTEAITVIGATTAHKFVAKEM